MKIIDIIILIFVISIFLLFIYYRFIKKGHSVCNSCPEYKNCCSKGESLKEYYHKTCKEEI